MKKTKHKHKYEKLSVRRIAYGHDDHEELSAICIQEVHSFECEHCNEVVTGSTVDEVREKLTFVIGGSSEGHVCEKCKEEIGNLESFFG